MAIDILYEKIQFTIILTINQFINVSFLSMRLNRSYFVLQKYY